MKGHYKPWTSEKDAELVSLWDANRTQLEIAAILQRSKGSVYERAKFLKLRRRSLSNVNKTVGFWTAEKDAGLRSLFAEGKAFSEISKEIGAASRNACIGRAHRLGLRREQEANQTNKRGSTAKATQASAEARRRRAGAVTPRPVLTVKAGNQVFHAAAEREAREAIRANAWDVLKGTSPVHFTDTNFNRTLHCSWPVSENVEMRCAQPIAKGSYCACHAAIAYAAPKPRSSANDLMRSLRRYAA